MGIRRNVMAGLATLAVGAAALDSTPGLAAPGALEPPKKAIRTLGTPAKPADTAKPAGTAAAAAGTAAAAAGTAAAAAGTAAAAAGTAAAAAGTAAAAAGTAAAAAGSAAAAAGSAAPAGSAGSVLSKFDPAKLGNRDARLEALRVRIEERQKTLEPRRQAERDRLRIRWGAVVQQPSVAQALQLHAFRVARLERIQELAQVEGKPAVAARASKALDRENVRHERTMAALASGAAAPPIPAPAPGGAR